jgi:Domain of unknown function (DUF4351)
VQAHLAAQATKNKESQQRRGKQKFALTTKLYEKGLSRQEVINLFRFIDWAMTLPPELEEAFRNDLVAYNGGEKMTYITSIERMAMAKGKADLVVKLLTFKLGNLSEETLAKVVSLPIDQLEQLAEDLLNFSDSNDLADWLQRL